MDQEEARRRFAAARVAALATVDASGRPHVVPVVFAVDGDAIWWAVDHKRKRTTALRRLANIAAEPRVAVLAHGYDEDWSSLWWARADGTATVVEHPEERRRGLDALAARYPQHAERRPEGPVVRVDVERWTGWSATAG